MQRWRTQTGLALRTLASPVFVFSLVVLVLNDHVVKQAWPGWVTGKVSDVAGLVVAPLLLAVVLTALRLPRPVPVALAMTGLGFTLTKGWESGATFASTVWSMTGIPTQIRADPTDLLALPALYAAWWVHRTVRDRPTQGWRHMLALAVGMAALPSGLLATAATSCDDFDGYVEVSRVAGEFPGPPPGVEERLMLGGYYPHTSVDATRRFAEPDVEVVGSVGREPEECDPAHPAHCWRIVGDDAVLIETTEDGGRSWRVDYEMDEETREDVRASLVDGCDGEPPAVTALDLGVLPSGDDPVVVVGLGPAGVLLRQSDASWTLMDESEIRVAVSRGQPPSPRPRVTPVDQPSPSPSPGSPSGPDCPSPSLVSVTPDPRNGPPTTYYVCP